MLDRRELFIAGATGAVALSLGSGDAQAKTSASRTPERVRYITGGPPADHVPPELNVPLQTLEIGDGHIAYWDTGGKDEPIILLHPATGSSQVWAYQVRDFTAAGYRVIGYSRRGHAGSSPVQADSPATALSDLQALVKHLSLGPAHLVGSAAGAFICAAFAQAQPASAKSVTIACSIVAIADPAIRALVPWLFEPWWNEVPHHARELSPSYLGHNPKGHAKWEELYEASRGGNPVATQAVGAQMTLASFGALPVPVLLIYGDADLYSPPTVGRTMVEAMPQQAELVILSECGHSAYWERPGDFNGAVMEFIARRTS